MHRVDRKVGKTVAGVDTIGIWLRDARSVVRRRGAETVGDPGPRISRGDRVLENASVELSRCGLLELLELRHESHEVLRPGVGVEIVLRLPLLDEDEPGRVVHALEELVRQAAGLLPGRVDQLAVDLECTRLVPFVDRAGNEHSHGHSVIRAVSAGVGTTGVRGEAHASTLPVRSRECRRLRRAVWAPMATCRRPVTGVTGHGFDRWPSTTVMFSESARQGGTDTTAKLFGAAAKWLDPPGEPHFLKIPGDTCFLEE